MSIYQSTKFKCDISKIKRKKRIFSFSKSSKFHIHRTSYSMKFVRLCRFSSDFILNINGIAQILKVFAPLLIIVKIEADENEITIKMTVKSESFYRSSPNWIPISLNFSSLLYQIWVRMIEDYVSGRKSKFSATRTVRHFSQNSNS